MRHHIHPEDGQREETEQKAEADRQTTVRDILRFHKKHNDYECPEDPNVTTKELLKLMDGIGHGLVFIKAFQLKCRNENDREKDERRDEISRKGTNIAVKTGTEDEPECQSESGADYKDVDAGQEEFMFGDAH